MFVFIYKLYFFVVLWCFFVFVWFGVLFLFCCCFLGGEGGCYGDIKVILYNVVLNMNVLVLNGILYFLDEMNRLEGVLIIDK